MVFYQSIILKFKNQLYGKYGIWFKLLEVRILRKKNCKLDRGYYFATFLLLNFSTSWGGQCASLIQCQSIGVRGIDMRSIHFVCIKLVENYKLYSSSNLNTNVMSHEWWVHFSMHEAATAGGCCHSAGDGGTHCGQ